MVKSAENSGDLQKGCDSRAFVPLQRFCCPHDLYMRAKGTCKFQPQEENDQDNSTDQRELGAVKTEKKVCPGTTHSTKYLFQILLRSSNLDHFAYLSLHPPSLKPKDVHSVACCFLCPRQYSGVIFFDLHCFLHMHSDR